MGNQFFQFKQFLINQDKCAMKVGTDSVLLACFTLLGNCNNCLDIGTGTGILSLMLAQKKTNFKIDAIEMDEHAYFQAKQNFEASPFSHQINISHVALQLYELKVKYDLIITNPPYFISNHNFAISDAQRSKARHNDDLPFQVLINCAFNLLKTNGVFNLILPFNEATIFKKLAIENGFFCKQSIYIKAKENKPCNRIILSLVKQPISETSKEFIIYNADNSQTEAYKELVKDYYL